MESNWIQDREHHTHAMAQHAPWLLHSSNSGAISPRARGRSRPRRTTPRLFTALYGLGNIAFRRNARHSGHIMVCAKRLHRYRTKWVPIHVGTRNKNGAYCQGHRSTV